MYEVWQSMNSWVVEVRESISTIRFVNLYLALLVGAWRIFSLKDLGSLPLLLRNRKELGPAGFFHDVRAGLSLRHLLFKTHWNVETGAGKPLETFNFFLEKQKMCTFSKQHGSRVKMAPCFELVCWPRKKIRQILESSFRNSEAPQKTCFFFCFFFWIVSL